MSRKSILLPLLLTKTYGDGNCQPNRSVDATVAPAGPRTLPKGCIAPLISGSAALHAASRSRRFAKLSHTALDHSRIGSVASCAPGSYFARCSLAYELLPLISPRTLQANLRAALIIVLFAPMTPAPYLSAGSAPVFTSILAAVGPMRSKRRFRCTTTASRPRCTQRRSLFPLA